MHARFPLASIVIAMVVGACAAGSAPPPSAVSTADPAATLVATPVATTPPSSRASASPASPAAPAAFTSRTYGYSVTVPAGWNTVQAMLVWDGKGMPGHDVAEADQFVGPAKASAWFYGAPTSNDLAAQVKAVIAGTAADHGDTCPPVPATQEPITIGGEPGILLSYDCGILINNAVTVHDGKAYLFGLRDPDVHAATDPTDRQTLLALVESVRFPD